MDVKENFMGNYSKAEILRIVEDEDVEFIRLQFTDMFGNLKNIAIPASRLIKAMENRCTIDMASLEGFDRGEETDRILILLIYCPGAHSRERWRGFCAMYAWKTARNMRRAPGRF